MKVGRNEGTKEEKKEERFVKSDLAVQCMYLTKKNGFSNFCFHLAGICGSPNSSSRTPSCALEDSPPGSLVGMEGAVTASSRKEVSSSRSRSSPRASNSASSSSCDLREATERAQCNGYDESSQGIHSFFLVFFFLASFFHFLYDEVVGKCKKVVGMSQRLTHTDRAQIL